MRRLLSLLLALSCLLSLCACGAAVEPPAPAAEEDAPAAEEDAPAVEEAAPAVEEEEASPSILAEPDGSPLDDIDTLADGLKDAIAGSIRVCLSGDKGENRVCSPLNITMALAMLAETSGGSSRAQILRLLGARDIYELRVRTNLIWRLNHCDEENCVSILANSLWLNRELAYRPEAVEQLAKYYFAYCFQGEMGSPEYDELLRGWVEEQTRGQLHDSVSDLGLNPDLAMALVSTVYFKSNWQDPFSEEETLDQVFHAPDGDQIVPFMHQTLSTNYYKFDTFSAVAMDLSGGRDMWFLLPSEELRPEDLLQDEQMMAFLLSQSRWYDFMQQCQHFTEVKFSLPKFDIHSELDLIEGLRQLGVTEVFDPSRADFSPLLGDQTGASVSQIRHAARVRIDEKGCEAAAFTEIDEDWASDWDESVDFVLDRPFLFMITDDMNLPLFIGVVNHPAA